jgi:hypothetical protein
MRVALRQRPQSTEHIDEPGLGAILTMLEPTR